MPGKAAISRGMALLALLFVVFFPDQEANGSWWIDLEAFHMSAHGRNACIDCHKDHGNPAFHPDSSVVNNEVEDFFAVDQCLSCHDHIQADLAKGQHGKKQVANPQEYGSCLRCHHPHYEPQMGHKPSPIEPAALRVKRCGVCHEERERLPPPAKTDTTCVGCHGLRDGAGPKGDQEIAQFCFHCHSTRARVPKGSLIPRMDAKQYEETPHSGEACTACHPKAPNFPHNKQTLGDCGQCHVPHHEAVAHDAHRVVACGACHLRGITPVRDPGRRVVLWKRGPRSEAPSEIHHMAVEDPEITCLGCHFKENLVGAAAMLLPPKSILCMPCHTSTFTANDWVSLTTLVVLFLGLGITFFYWFSGSARTGTQPKASLFLKAGPILKVIVLDIFLQRRLYHQSQRRWFIHALIFYPFVVRFTWGFLSLLGSLWIPQWASVWAMIDKNHPATAALFDLTGLMMFLGIILALGRSLWKRPSLKGLPRHDPWVLVLMAFVVIAGFGVEGIRMTMTGWPEGSHYAFVGYLISLGFSGVPGLTGLYGYIWFAHALLYAAFVAYIPFSRMLHILLGPLVLILNSIKGHGDGRQLMADH